MASRADDVFGSITGTNRQSPRRKAIMRNNYARASQRGTVSSVPAYTGMGQ